MINNLMLKYNKMILNKTYKNYLNKKLNKILYKKKMNKIKNLYIYQKYFKHYLNIKKCDLYYIISYIVLKFNIKI
jgi:hypothetical protein